MPALAGKKARLKVSTTSGGTYNDVQGGGTFSHDMSANNIDDSEFGVDYVARIQGLKDGRISWSGKLVPGDTNGQTVVKNAYLNDTPLFVRALPDNGVTAGAGAQQEMKVSSWRVDASVPDRVTLAIEFEGSGVITSV